MASSKLINVSSTITFLVLIANVLQSTSSPIPTTSENGSCSQSKPGSPKFLFHNQTQQCYKEKSKGPCAGNMVMYPLDKVYGDCDCPDKGLPWVYNPKLDDCFQTFKQAHCSDGEWLVFDESLMEPGCKPNPCLGDLSTNEDIILYKNKCVSFGSPSEMCPNPSGEVVKILPGEVLPKCVPDDGSVNDYTLSKTNKLKCRPGSRRDVNNTCRRTITSSVAFDP